VEVASAKKGSSLVADNIKQRSKTLSAKLLAHEQARAFYMPSYNVPAGDAAAEVQKQPLRLPSSFQAGHLERNRDRNRICPPALTEAETTLRLAALGDALADLIRHLRTRTFLLRYRAKSAEGVRQNTRIRDSVAGVSRRIDAAATGYRRHRLAYKCLVGEGDWEKTYRPLTAQDVRGLSEQAVKDSELEERYRTRVLTEALASVLRTGQPITTQDAADLLKLREAQRKREAQRDNDEEDDDSEDEAEGDMEGIDTMRPLAQSAKALAEQVALGEGRRKLSWIWTMGLRLNNVVDKQLTDSTCFFSRILCSWADFMHSGLRVEWLRAKARRDQWMEEVMLVTKEMRQNIAFCKHEYERWLSIADTKLGWQDLSLDAVEAEGRRAYALERATDKQLRSIQLATMWRPIYKELLKTDFCRDGRTLARD
jgi:hypothetical protein